MVPVTQMGSQQMEPCRLNHVVAGHHSRKTKIGHGENSTLSASGCGITGKSLSPLCLSVLICKMRAKTLCSLLEFW